MSYRPYQLECVDRTIESMRYYRSVLNVLPTGSGKSWVIRRLIDDVKGYGCQYTLLMVHKLELVSQLAETLVDGGLKVVIEQAENIELQTNRNFDVAVCSIQTLLSRPEVLAGIPWGMVLIDETHRALADGYTAILDRIGAGQPAGPYLVGFTATAFRGDSQPMTALYQTVAYKRDVLWGINEGWLVPIRAKRIARREVNEAGRLVTRVMEGEELYESTYDTYIEYCTDGQGVCTRPSLIMVGSIEEGRAVAEYFREHGTEAQMVDSLMDQKERFEHTRRFKAGKLDVLVSLNVITEGFDAPRASALFWLRSTSSAVIFVQALGRITRPVFTPEEMEAFNAAPDAAIRRQLIAQSVKPDGIFFDATDDSSRYNLVTVGAVFGLRPDFDFDGELIADVVGEIDNLLDQYSVVSADAISCVDDIGLVLESAELWRQAVTPNVGVPTNAQFVYTHHRDAWLLTFPVQDRTQDVSIPHSLRIEEDARGGWTASIGQPEVWREWYWNSGKRQWAQKYHRGRTRPDTSKTIQMGARTMPRYTQLCGMPFQPIAVALTKEEIFGAAEAYVLEHYGGQKLLRLLDRNAPWRAGAPTDRQMRLLDQMRRKGIALPEFVNSGTASVLTDRYFLGLLEPVRLKTKRTP